MNTLEFEQFLHQQIPITKSMGFTVAEFTPSSVKISAKLSPNINHKSTAFGGSINCLMTVCGWALTYANVKPIDPNTHIVISKSNIHYILPIRDDFTTECTLDLKNQTKFIDAYKKYKKGILKLNVCCYDKDTLLAEFNGQYVAFNHA